MNRLVIPIKGLILYTTGDVKLWVEIVLLLDDRSGNPKRRSFRIDSASDLTTEKK
jgi:hypothetical protein